MTKCQGVYRCCPAALVLLFFQAVVHAEPLTHDETVRLALERSPSIQAQGLAIEGAESSATAAGRLPDPELIVGIDNLPIEGPDAYSVSRDFMTMRKVGVMQSFPSQRKRAAQRERAGAAMSLAESQGLQLRTEIARAAADAWVMAQAAELALAQLHQLEPEVNLQAQAARTALANARGSAVDALAAQSDKSELADRILQAQREVRVARAALMQWIGEDGGRPLASIQAFRELPAPREELLASMHRHAALLSFDAQRAVAQSEIDLAEAEKRADWSTQLTYSKRGDAFSDMVSLEFRIGLPLFGGKRQDPQIAARHADLSRLGAEREAELRMHTAEVSDALFAWDAARGRIELYENERLPLARQRSQAALSGFRAGTVDMTALLASHVAEIEVQRSYAELVRELGQAWVFLRYLDTGQEPQ